MANGPLGGFMPTPAAPAQPPQVKLDTTADSRGNFNNFLKNMNGATLVNPPVVAPTMGAMTPNMAPALANIDIFNQPVSMMEQGGNVPPRNTNIMGQPHMLAYITPQEGQLLENLGGANQPGPMGIPSFFDTGEGDFGYGTEGSAVGGGSESSDDDESTVDDDPVAGVDFDEETGKFDVVSTPTVTEQEQQQNIAESQQFVDSPSIPNITFTNETINNALKNFPNANRFAKSDIKAELEDYAKKGDFVGALDYFQKEGGLGEKVVNNIIQASGVQPAAYSAAVFNQPTVKDILGTDEKTVLGEVDLTGKVIDPFDIQPTVITTPAAMGLPGVTSRFSTQTKATPDVPTLSAATQFARNVEDQRAAERGRALGPTTFDDSLDRLNQQIQDRNQQIQERGTSSQNILDLIAEENFRRTVGDPSVPDLVLPGTSFTTLPDGTKITEGPGFTKTEKTTRTAADRGLGTSGLTKDDIKNIQDAADRDLLARSVEDKSRIFEPSTNIRGVNIPNYIGRGLNKIAELTDQRVMRGITERGLTPVYDRDGTITGAKDKFGNLIEGMDFSIQDRAEGDNDPVQDVIRPLTPKPEVDPKPDLPPNVIGGTSGQIGNLQPITDDTVVASPFAPASSNIQPITFDSGQLNRLIELLTGVPARPAVSAKKGGVIGMANGGLIKAVDDFLAAG